MREKELIAAAQDDNRRIKYAFLVDKGFTIEQARALARLSWKSIDKIVRQRIH